MICSNRRTKLRKVPVIVKDCTRTKCFLMTSALYFNRHYLKMGSMRFVVTAGGQPVRWRGLALRSHKVKSNPVLFLRLTVVAMPLGAFDYWCLHHWKSKQLLTNYAGDHSTKYRSSYKPISKPLQAQMGSMFVRRPITWNKRLMYCKTIILNCTLWCAGCLWFVVLI